MKLRIALITLICFSLLTSCKKDNEPEPTENTPAPAISSFSPVMGLPGDTVIVTGTNFSATTTGNTVKFGNNSAATVIEASATQLKVKVPAGAANGNISVMVAAAQATSTTSFEVLNDIPRNNLVAFYPFTNNVNDAGANAFNLTLYGTYNAVADRFGNTNRAYYFNGGNSFAIASGKSAVQVSQPITLGAWIKYDSLISSSIMSKYYPNGFIFSVNSSGALIVYTDGGHITSTNASVLPKNTNGQWIFIAMSYDGTTLKFYKNGTSAGNYSYTGTITSDANSNNFRIGLDGYTSTGPESFKCSIDDVTVYSRVLSDTEIQQLMQQTVSKK
jgi:concanavalin A-like lectin/glucanase superfamily protein/IPT/TIG domain-containing protein